MNEVKFSYHKYSHSCPLRYQAIDPLHPNISINILYSLLFTFHFVLTRRICLTIKASLVSNHFPLVS